MSAIAVKKNNPIALTAPADFRSVKPVLKKIFGVSPTAQHGFARIVNGSA
jgi:hypothetical protein